MTGIVIVGAAAAGLAAAEELRRSGFGGAVTIVGGERHAPYDRPPLSKQALDGSWDAERLRLRNDGDLATLNARFVLGRHAVAADSTRRIVTLDDGEALSFDGLVIASGVTPTCPEGADLLTLRTSDDAVLLRRKLLPGTRVLIVGAGFLGTELAAASAKLGCHVTLLDRCDRLLDRLGSAVSRHVAALHEANGVDVRSRVNIAHVDASGAVLADGTELRADVVIACTGSRPATSWLTHSGLTIDDGVVCAADCAAAPGVVAAGDVARWFNPAYGVSMRVEHRTNATQQGAHAARTLLAELAGGHGDPYSSVPYAWSHQYDTRVQIHGAVLESDEAELAQGSEDEDSFIVAHRARGRLVAVVGVNASPRDLRAWQQQVYAEAARLSSLVG
ncbi:NAD(P)/FAD-dependent oxidoreductase [Microbacterium sp. P5_E9]